MTSSRKREIISEYPNHTVCKQGAAALCLHGHEETEMDYTTYPEGFEKLVKEIDMPFETEEQRRAYLLKVMKTLIQL